MPRSAPSICCKAGCGKQSHGRYCKAHEHLAVGWFDYKKGQTSKQRGYGAAWRKLRKMIILRDMAICQVCMAKGYVTASAEVDHIIPKAQGGTDAPENLQAICVPCHKVKTQRESMSGRRREQKKS